MYCESCGSFVPDGQAFCSACGTPTGISAAQPSSQLAVQPAVQSAPVPQPVVAQPVAAQPVAAQPVVAQPVAAQPVMQQPVQPVAQPVYQQPVYQQPVAQPVQPAAQPVYTQPVYAQPIVVTTTAPAAPAAPKNGAASKGLVFGILTFVLSWIPFLPYLFGLLGLIFSIVGLAKRGAPGKGKAVAGLILSVLGTIVAIVFQAFVWTMILSAITGTVGGSFGGGIDSIDLEEILFG